METSMGDNSNIEEGSDGDDEVVDVEQVDQDLDAAGHDQVNEVVPADKSAEKKNPKAQLKGENILETPAPIERQVEQQVN